MRILYIALKYDYAKRERGLSFEHYNFYDSLVKMENSSHEIIYFAFDEEMALVGREAMNKKLLRVVNEQKPDLCFFYLFTDEIFPDTIEKITMSGITTYNWFADDHWRWSIFSRHYAPKFTWVSTTDSQAIVKYHGIGYKNIIHTQWGCNQYLYHPQNKLADSKYKFDISFVGSPYGEREAIVRNLKNDKIQVSCFGAGWSIGRISQPQMLEVFESSKINLNFTKSSGGLDLKSLSKIFLQRRNGKIRLEHPKLWPDNTRSFMGRWRDQIKGRTFEVPACGGFLLSGYADNIYDYFRPDKEMVFFGCASELREKINFYLTHDIEREKIRIAGFQRVVREHTYEARFKDLFKTMGL